MGYTLRCTIPSASNSRNCCVSIFSVMEGICRRSSAKCQVRCCGTYLSSEKPLVAFG